MRIYEKNNMKKISPKLEFIKKNNFEISVTFSVLVAVLSFVFLGKPIVSISLALGIVAASLSQNGEHPKSKIRSCIIMIFCFALMSYGTTITKYFTIINVIWLGATTLVFTLVGGYSVRMKRWTISTSKLLSNDSGPSRNVSSRNLTTESHFMSDTRSGKSSEE